MKIENAGKIEKIIYYTKLDQKTFTYKKDKKNEGKNRKKRIYN